MNVSRPLLPALPLCAASAPAQAGETGSTTRIDKGTPATVTPEEPDPVRGDYHIDFATLDRDHDGFISRREAQANPTLAREFDALDTHRSGRPDKAQLEGWMTQ
ncbi:MULTISPECIES: hypothetical protein [Stenotrophomonas]|uniref:hypothetical protein n=1 Tax=Stenotrophomonas TaxID=40323 RepID=UPI001CF0D5EC|nr:MULTISPECIES: hypothetical protein [Stenotrophomonas]MCA7023216.1 hypothetical protein [Stenotrophomonas acidaminiphila]MCE4076385.1 hypothetical protein [Stenotrophomonas acidaminiphila]